MELSAENQATLERIRGNLVTFERRKQARHSDLFYPEWCGVFCVDVEELLHIIDRLRVADSDCICGASDYENRFCPVHGCAVTAVTSAIRVPVASGTGWPVP